MAQKRTKPKAKRPPPRHQLTLDEAIARLGLTGVTHRRMFGGLCYYANGTPFSFLLGEDLALKLPAMQLVSASASRAGDLFHPGGGEFVMREYLALSTQTLTDEDTIDEFVRASYGFVSGQAGPPEELGQRDLLEGRSGLYQKKKRPVRQKGKP